MATLHPFRALRPRPQVAEEVACVPYDVINTEEARRLAAGRPLSFLHVIRPEIDLPEDVDEHDEAVYQKGAANLKQYAESAHSLEEDAPSVYVYRLVMNGRPQTGIFGCVSVADYDDDTILKHELTRPAKENDRTKHILTQRAHAEPVMLTFRSSDAVDRQIDAAVEADPLYDFEAEDGVHHTIWRVDATDDLVAAFADVPKLYVADGHHRCKAASRAAHELGPDPDAEHSYFPAVLFPMDNMEILAYNRIVRELPMSADAFLDAVAEQGTLRRDTGRKVPERRGEVCLYLGGAWHTLELAEPTVDDAAGGLDVARLSASVLAPILDITDPRRDPNIDFVGGIRGTDELERLVDDGKAAVAFSMYPTSVEELVDVSDAGQLMPPKSTWFEPKLRSGLLVHLF